MAEGKVYNVRINSDLAQLVDEKQIVQKQGTATNESDLEASITLTVSAQQTTALTVSRSSGPSGISVNFNSPGAEVKIGSVVVSIPPINETIVWGETKEESRNVEVSTEVVVPKKSKVTYAYVGTIGTFSIPFSYTLEDKNITTEHTDGIYTVVQYYDFNFQIEVQPL